MRPEYYLLPSRKAKGYKVVPPINLNFALKIFIVDIIFPFISYDKDEKIGLPPEPILNDIWVI